MWLAHAGVERAHAPLLLILRHRQCEVQRVAELVDRKGVHQHGLVQLARRAGEARQHQHAAMVGARGDELLGDQIHAVVQRRHDAHRGRAVERGDLRRLAMLVDVDDRAPALGARSGR